MNKVSYWKNRYLCGLTVWDIGQISTPLKSYIDKLKNKELKILIPGAGNAYEAEYLYHQGFKNIFVADIVKKPLLNLKERVPGFPEDQLLHQDFFSIKDEFDLILEQTFFCAISPSLRSEYALKASELLVKTGKIAGVLFQTEFAKEGPPFGGNKEEYLTYFSPYFKIETLETCYNSILPRQGKELFFIFSKK